LPAKIQSKYPLDDPAIDTKYAKNVYYSRGLVTKS
jgi:hypothetical protein